MDTRLTAWTDRLTTLKGLTVHYRHPKIENVCVVVHGWTPGHKHSPNEITGVYPTPLATLQQVSQALRYARKVAADLGACLFEAPSIGFTVREMRRDGSWIKAR